MIGDFLYSIFRKKKHPKISFFFNRKIAMEFTLPWGYGVIL